MDCMAYFGVDHGLILMLMWHWITLAVMSRLRLATTLAWTYMICFVRCLGRILLVYKEPPGPHKMTFRFRWHSSVQASRQAWESCFGSGGGDGAGDVGLARARPLPHPDWASYLQTYLSLRLSDWILDLRLRHADMFDTSASFWSLLEASEPSPSSSRLSLCAVEPATKNDQHRVHAEPCVHHTVDWQ